MPTALKLSGLILALAVAAAVAVYTVPSLRRFIAGIVPTTWTIAVGAWRRGIDVDHHQTLTTPDGTRLAASLYKPVRAQHPLPTILIRLPYHRLRHSEGYSNALFFASHGYAVLVQDLRGTGDSGGELHPWAHSAEDAIATIDWITRQNWSNGTVGTTGCSALGETQLVAQDRAVSGWLAMVPIGAGGAIGPLGGRHEYFGVFEGGVFQLASGFGWFVTSGSRRPDAPAAIPFDTDRILRELPISDLVQRVRPAPNGYRDFLSTPLGDANWAKWGYLTDESRMRVPALMVNTWGDQTLSGTLAIVEHWRKSDPAATAGRLKTIIAPGNHCAHEQMGGLGRFGVLEIENGGLDYHATYLRWFDYWLKGLGSGLADMPAYTFYVIGEGAWRTSETWPPSEARRQRWWLGSAGRANSSSGNGSLTLQPPAGATLDTWRYDPADPVPSRGGPICCAGSNVVAGPADQADVELRDDVLVYTSPPLEQDLVIAGPIRLQLQVSSNAKDTDLVARLAHVLPDNTSIGIQEGALRLRYRNGMATPEFVERGERVEARVDMRDLAYRLPKGHRLRLHLTSSSFPRLERNLNTGTENATETRMIVATNNVHYDQAEAGSWLELDVLPSMSSAP